MTKIPEKAMKCLALALNESAPDGEWNSAAIKFIAILRKNKIEAFGFFDSPPKEPGREATTQCADIMPFGKFKGSLVSDLPDWYLDWCLEQEFIKDKLRRAINREFFNRNPQ